MAAIGKLAEVILYVQDMAAQVAFYQNILGFRVKEPQDTADFSQVYWVELDTGGCTLALHAGGAGRFGPDAPKIVFQVSNIETVRAELLAKGVALSEVRSPAPNIWVCDGVDAEGNNFSIEARHEP